jgi:hypothetical protein
MEARLNLDRFLKDRNLERYRKLACPTTTRTERELLFAVLDEEKVRCFALPNVRTVALPSAIGERAMGTRTRGFEPHHLRAMLSAFDVVCAQLRLPTYEGGRARKRAASMIFDLAMTGETDEKRLVAKYSPNSLSKRVIEGNAQLVITGGDRCRRQPLSAPPGRNGRRLNAG